MRGRLVLPKKLAKNHTNASLKSRNITITVSAINKQKKTEKVTHIFKLKSVSEKVNQPLAGRLRVAEHHRVQGLLQLLSDRGHWVDN